LIFAVTVDALVVLPFETSRTSAALTVDQSISSWADTVLTVPDEWRWAKTSLGSFVPMFLRWALNTVGSEKSWGTDTVLTVPDSLFSTDTIVTVPESWGWALNAVWSVSVGWANALGTVPESCWWWASAVLSGPDLTGWANTGLGYFVPMFLRWALNTVGSEKSWGTDTVLTVPDSLFSADTVVTVPESWGWALNAVWSVSVGWANALGTVPESCWWWASAVLSGPDLTSWANTSLGFFIPMFFRWTLNAVWSEKSWSANAVLTVPDSLFSTDTIVTVPESWGWALNAVWSVSVGWANALGTVPESCWWWANAVLSVPDLAGWAETGLGSFVPMFFRWAANAVLSESVDWADTCVSVPNCFWSWANTLI
jgi:hypothetical protein